MRRLKRNAIKEAFDNLPSGACFFDSNGMVTLCNHQMHRLVFALTGRDLQSLPELRDILHGGDTESKQRDKDIVVLENGSAWRFLQESVTTQDGNTYTQVTATDVTELYHRQKELEKDNKRLEEYAQRMRSLSANILTLIREEEILNMKIRVHDDIGRSVIATRSFLQKNRPTEQLDLTAWKNAVHLLKHDNEILEEKDAVSRLMSAADSINIKIVINGEFSQNIHAAELLITAVRECMTNAVRHAGASELYVSLTCDNDMAAAVITNNGEAPSGNITESGGLSSLRNRIEKDGGTMKIQSTPGFELSVSVPIRLGVTL
ncbi:MAG: ATP-binding protein [Oscillospiraceae bacterium]